MKMPIRFTIGDTTGVVDPTGSYLGPKERWSPQRLLNATGLIPYFTLDMPEGTNGVDQVMDHMVNQYGFGDLPPMGGVVNDLGIYEYPEDEPLSPYIRITKAGVDIYVYPYGIVSVVGMDSQKTVRMD